MKTSISCAGRPAFYSVKQAACILCVDEHVVSQAIRLGTLRTTRRYGRLVIPASSVTRLLGQPIADGAQPAGGVT